MAALTACMRALFTTQPGFGHLNPFLPYAVALREAGHEVRFASAPAFAEAIAQHGFPCVGIGEDFTWEKASEYFPAIDEAARAGRAIEFATFDIGWKLWNPKAVRDLLSLFERWRPDVIVRELAENGATLAGEAAGVPVVCAAWGFLPADRDSWGTVFDWDRWLACYAKVRREVGLPSDRSVSAWTRQLTFSPLPPSWLGGRDWETRVRHFRVLLSEGSADFCPAWLASMGRDRPLVYATLGTVFNKMRRLRTAMLDALAALDADVLMTIGRDVDPRGIGSVPSNVRVEPFVAQSLVLPRASLVVSHAGLGTMLGAIYHGVPMVVVSIAGDQLLNARRAAELGIAIALDRREAEAPLLHSTAERALGDKELRATAQALRDECDAMDPISEAVKALEHVADEAPGEN
jgi:UDP:flavonoid glycosyltransferase YjiC (YdhE family)